MKTLLYEIACKLGKRKENQCNSKVNITLESVAVCAGGETACVLKQAWTVR